MHGTEANAIIDRDGYDLLDPKTKVIASYRVPRKPPPPTSSADLVGADAMTDAHFANLIAATCTGVPLRQPVAQGNVAVTMLQLSNIVYSTGSELKTDPQSFAIRDNPRAEQMTRRHYAEGWAPRV